MTSTINMTLPKDKPSSNVKLYIPRIEMLMYLTVSELDLFMDFAFLAKLHLFAPLSASSKVCLK